MGAQTFGLQHVGYIILDTTVIKPRLEMIRVLHFFVEAIIGLLSVSKFEQHTPHYPMQTTL